MIAVRAVAIGVSGLLPRIAPCACARAAAGAQRGVDQRVDPARNRNPDRGRPKLVSRNPRRVPVTLSVAPSPFARHSPQFLLPVRHSNWDTGAGHRSDSRLFISDTPSSAGSAADRQGRELATLRGRGVRSHRVPKNRSVRFARIVRRQPPLRSEPPEHRGINPIVSLPTKSRAIHCEVYDGIGKWHPDGRGPSSVGLEYQPSCIDFDLSYPVVCSDHGVEVSGGRGVVGVGGPDLDAHGAEGHGDFTYGAS